MTDNSVAAAAGGVPPPARIVLTVLIPFGCGFYLSYLLRTVNAVISPQLVAELGLTPADLGFLTSVYFIAFASIQLPLGVVLDRYGPRRVQAVLLLIAAAGGVLFGVGHSFAVLSLGRALIGLGVAACLMAAFKANAIWWPTERLPLFNNIIVAFGSFGALSATAPVEALLQVTGWREIFLGLAAATAGLAAITYAIVPERPSAADTSVSFTEQFAAIGVIFRSGFFWRVGFMFVLCHAAFLTYQTLWAAPWLRDIAGLDRAGVADHMLLIQIGMFAGVLCSGVIADRLRLYGIQPLTVVSGSVVVFLVVQTLLAFGVAGYPALLWTAYGFFGAMTILSFAIITAHFPSEHTGRAITAANLLVFVTAFFAQWGVGAIIGLFEPLADGSGRPVAHMTAFLVVVGLQAAGFIYFAWPRRRQT